MSERVLKRSFNPVSQLRHSLLLNAFSQSLMGEFEAKECSRCFPSGMGRETPVGTKVDEDRQCCLHPHHGLWDSTLETKPRQFQGEGGV